MAQLARDELEAHGLLAGQQLTQAGRVLARAWTWPFDRRELASALLRITERTLDGDCRRGGWVPETLIVGEAWSAGWKPFAGLQAVLMPALADGIIECNCTTPGSAFFRLAEANFDLDDMVGGAGSDAIVDELRPVYIKEYRATWRRILTDRDLYQELGECPLPVAIPLQSDRAYDDVAGIEPLLPVKESFLVVDSTSAAASLPETPTASAASATNSDTTETFTTRRDSQGND